MSKAIPLKRRTFVKYAASIGTAGSTLLLGGCNEGLLSEAAINQHSPASVETFFQISLAQWSLHRSLRKDLDNLDFAAKARELGIGAVEYVNQFFSDKAEDTAYLNQMNQRARDHGVNNLRIMIDGEGGLAHQDARQRQQAVINHHKWVRAAKQLGCQDIRVNTRGKGDSDEVAKRAVESLHALAEYAAPEGIGIIVENHGGWSSDGEWLARVISEVNLPNCGTLPDFGNFLMSLFPLRQYDRYQGTTELMPFARGVSAKSYDFDASGEETRIDYRRMLTIVKDSGYRGFIGVEYEGSRLSEEAGIRATLNLLQRYGRVA